MFFSEDWKVLEIETRLRYGYDGSLINNRKVKVKQDKLLRFCAVSTYFKIKMSK